MPLSERDEMLIERILEDYDTFTARLEFSSMDEEKFCNDHSFEGEYAYDAVMNPCTASSRTLHTFRKTSPTTPRISLGRRSWGSAISSLTGTPRLTATSFGRL